MKIASSISPKITFLLPDTMPEEKQHAFVAEFDKHVPIACGVRPGRNLGNPLSRRSIIPCDPERRPNRDE